MLQENEISHEGQYDIFVSLRWILATPSLNNHCHLTEAPEGARLFPTAYDRANQEIGSKYKNNFSMISFVHSFGLFKVDCQGVENAHEEYDPYLPEFPAVAIHAFHSNCLKIWYNRFSPFLD